MAKFEDLTGKKFNQLTVLERSGNFEFNSTKYQAKWKCLCDCGETVYTGTTFLKQGKSRSCNKCGNKKRSINNRKISIYSVIFNKKVAKVAGRRNIKVNMTAEEYYNIAKNNCHYCGIEPIEFNPYKYSTKQESIYVHGVDRIDSSGDYEVSNCVSCCTDCNYAKKELSVDQFMSLVERIYNHSIKDKK